MMDISEKDGEKTGRDPNRSSCFKLAKNVLLRLETDRKQAQEETCRDVFRVLKTRLRLTSLVLHPPGRITAE